MSNNCMERNHGGEEEDVPGFLIFALYINNPKLKHRNNNQCCREEAEGKDIYPLRFWQQYGGCPIARNTTKPPPISMIFFPRSKSRHSAPETLVSSRYSSKSVGMLLSRGVASYRCL